MLVTSPPYSRSLIYWNLNYRTQKLLVFVHLWHKEAKVNGFFTIMKTTSVSLWIKCAWPVTALNSYYNIVVIWKYKTRTKKCLREVFERMVYGQFSSICILSLIWHALFQDINWSTDRVSLNQLLNVYDNHTYLFSLLWKTNNENRSANIRNTGLACLLKINCHFLVEALKWCGSERGFDSNSLLRRPVSASSVTLWDTGIEKKWKLQRLFSA